MKIGVSSQNFRTITGHAGKARRFFVFEVSPDRTVTERERIDLPKSQSMHESDPSLPHPLDDLDILITGGCGAGFVKKMVNRGVLVVATGATDPYEAVQCLVEGRPLPPPQPEESHSHGDHEHGHGHGHSHGHGCGCGH